MNIEKYRDNVRKVFTKLTNIPLKGVSRLENVRDVRNECEKVEAEFRSLVAKLAVSYEDELQLIAAMDNVAAYREKLGQAGAL